MAGHARGRRLQSSFTGMHRHGVVRAYVPKGTNYACIPTEVERNNGNPPPPFSIHDPERRALGHYIIQTFKYFIFLPFAIS